MYSIIIPVYNEELNIPPLLKSLEEFKRNGHEIIIVNDGSSDKSRSLLSKVGGIKVINFSNNKGKGSAVKKGLLLSTCDKIILFDGDNELDATQIKDLMILNKKFGVSCVFAKRIDKIFLKNFFWYLGNRFFTFLFNLINGSNVEDALCCAKAFYKQDLALEKLEASQFDIDVEIAGQLVLKNKNISSINLNYIRRNKNQGKKLKMRDGIKILLRILKNY